MIWLPDHLVRSKYSNVLKPCVMALPLRTALERRYAPILDRVTLCYVRFGCFPWTARSASNELGFKQIEFFDRTGWAKTAPDITGGRAAGYPLYHRHVAQLLQRSGGCLPWQRVLGSGGAIKLKYEAGIEQRLRLEIEDVRFRGKRVDMAEHQHRFRTWEF